MQAHSDMAREISVDGCPEKLVCLAVSRPVPPLSHVRAAARQAVRRREGLIAEKYIRAAGRIRPYNESNESG